MQIVTGYAGQAHITSNDDQGRNQGTFGEDSYVLSVGSKFEPTLVSANQLRIADGEAVMQGVHFRVEPSSFDTVSIANGTQGRNRKDLVVCRYQKNGSTGVESCQWVVIQGTATTGTATRPDFVRGDILDGALSADMPFFEVVISGVNVTAVNRIYNTVLSMEELQTIANQNRDSISVLNTNVNDVIVGTFTKNSTQSSLTNSLTIRQVGHVVTVFGFVSNVNISASNTNITLGTISDVSLPANAVRGLCMVGANAYSSTTPSYIAVDTGGALSVSSSNTGTGKAIYFNLTWIR